MKTKDIKIDLKPGTELTIAHEICGVSGRILFKEGEKVIVEKLHIKEGHWGRRSSTWYDEELTGITLEGHEESIFFPSLFEEFITYV